MHKYLLILLFVIYCSFGSAQQDYFNNVYNENVWSSALSVHQNEIGYISCGVSGTNYGPYLLRRIAIVQTDIDGEMLWWKEYGSGLREFYSGGTRGFIKTTDGGYIVSGSMVDTNRCVGILWKFDSNLDSTWIMTFGDTSSINYNGTIFNCCLQLPDGGFIITGEKYVSEDDGDIILVRTDSLGNELWTRQYGLAGYLEAGYSLALLPENGYLIGFNRINLNIVASHDPGMIKVDSVGDVVWERIYSGPHQDGIAHVLVGKDGNYYFGSTYAIEQHYPSYPHHKIWLVKTDTNGIKIWDKLYGDTYFLGFCSTIDLIDSTILLSGSGSFNEIPGNLGWILSVNMDGDSNWMRKYAYNFDESNYIFDICLTNDNGIILTGESFSPSMPQSIWLQKLDSIGCDSAGCDPSVHIYNVAIDNDPNVLIYPNPAKDLIHIHCRREFDAITISNMQNQEIDFRLDSDKTINISHLTSGLYIVEIFGDSWRIRKKIIKF